MAGAVDWALIGVDATGVASSAATPICRALGAVATRSARCLLGVMQGLSSTISRERPIDLTKEPERPSLHDDESGGDSHSQRVAK